MTPNIIRVDPDVYAAALKAKAALEAKTGRPQSLNDGLRHLLGLA